MFESSACVGAGRKHNANEQAECKQQLVAFNKPDTVVADVASQLWYRPNQFCN